MTEQEKNHESWTDDQKWAYLVRHERLGELLVRQGKLTLGQLTMALDEQAKSQGTIHLGQIIIDKKFLSLDEIVAALDKQKQISRTSVDTIQKLKIRDKE